MAVKPVTVIEEVDLRMLENLGEQNAGLQRAFLGFRGVLHWFWLTTRMECIVVLPDFQVKLLFVHVQIGSNLTCRFWMELRGSRFFQLPTNRSSYM